MADHISRKELKKDKIHDAIEHGAEAFYLHKQITLAILLLVLVIAVGWGSWSVYHDRQSAAANAGLTIAMKAYSGRIGGAPDPQDPTDVAYTDETARANDAVTKFTAVANKYPQCRRCHHGPLLLSHKSMMTAMAHDLLTLPRTTRLRRLVRAHVEQVGNAQL